MTAVSYTHLTGLPPLGGFDTDNFCFDNRSLAQVDRLMGVGIENIRIYQGGSYYVNLRIPFLYAVSYTHLDVYKRQVPANPFWKQKTC